MHLAISSFSFWLLFSVYGSFFWPLKKKLVHLFPKTMFLFNIGINSCHWDHMHFFRLVLYRPWATAIKQYVRSTIQHKKHTKKRASVWACAIRREISREVLIWECSTPIAIKIKANNRETWRALVWPRIAQNKGQKRKKKKSVTLPLILTSKAINPSLRSIAAENQATKKASTKIDVNPINRPWLEPTRTATTFDKEIKIYHFLEYLYTADGSIILSSNSPSLPLE